MNIIRKTPDDKGYYPPIQCGVSGVYEGCALWPDSLETETFHQYNGFVVLTIEQVEGVDTVTDYVPNAEAWEAWKASLPEEPEPEPETPEEDVWSDMAAAITEGVNEV